MVDILAVRGDEGRLLGSDKPRRVIKHALTRGFPNGATRLVEILGHCMVSKVAMTERTRGTETSKYPQEEKSKEIP